MDLKKKEPIAVIKIYAASGNLGPVWDILGLALDMFNTYQVFYSNDKKYNIDFKDEYNPGLVTSEDNLIIKVIKRMLNEVIFNVSSLFQ